MWLACDTGGTFTDLVVESNGVWQSFKSPTVAADPVRGVLDVLDVAATGSGRSLKDFLSEAEVLVHATTHAINAVLTGNVAKTALLVTEGHRDILTLREGGRPDPFDHRTRYPKSFISRDLVFPIRERIDSDGSIFKALDEDQAIRVIHRLKEKKIEALAVCLLWSVANAQHELRVAELVRQHLPDVPFTLSHQINPTPREFRRAVSAAIDASLKPMMLNYFGGLVSRLADAGFKGKVLVVTSQGGVMEAADVVDAPINLVNSGPSMAPIAAQAYVSMDDDTRDIIVADTGGTTFDVSVVRSGRIPLTRELWIGQPILGLPTGYPSIDVRSVGTGGGSLARIDAGGMLHVGPQSAGARPGPACYGHGGLEPTVTDAALVLGYIDPDFFLGGRMRLDLKAAERAMASINGDATSIESTAASIIALATENMTQAIFDITVKQGVDPSKAVMVGGGGAAGLNAVFIARRLKCARLIIPETGATLSAAGAQISDLKGDYRASAFMSTERFDTAAADRILDSLEVQCQKFAERSGALPEKTRLNFTVEARYAEQAWEIEVGLPRTRFSSEGSLQGFLQAFHDEHRRLYGFADPDSAVEIVGWRASIACELRDTRPVRLKKDNAARHRSVTRKITLPDLTSYEAGAYDWNSLPIGKYHRGPAIVESAFTTVVVDDADFHVNASGSLVINL